MTDDQKQTATAIALLLAALASWITTSTSVIVTDTSGNPIRQTLCFDPQTNEYFDCRDPEFRVPASWS